MRLFLVFLLLAVILIGAEVVQAQDRTAATEPMSLQVTTDEEGILVSENGKPVLRYQAKPKSKNGTHRRANYVHPLYDLDGNLLTEDFPEDHLHHRGIFWAWHQVKVGDQIAGDGWLAKDFDWNVISRRTEVLNAGVVRISAEVQWLSPKIKDENKRPIPLVNETTIIELHASSNGQRIIDFEIRLLAAQPDVMIGGSDNVKGYGGFSARVIQPKDIAFNTVGGLVEATKTQLECGSWVDIVGTFGDNKTKSGLAILVHPSSAGYPQKWILRSTARSMQNPVYPGRTLIGVSQTEPTVLRYRMVLHQTELTVEELNSSFKEYAEGNGSSLSE